MAVTAATVASWGKFPAPTGAELELLERVVAAVTEHVEGGYEVSDPLTESEELAIIMQCSRLWRRRDTPEGVAAFADVAAIRLGRLDPDVANMLVPRFTFG